MSSMSLDRLQLPFVQVTMVFHQSYVIQSQSLFSLINSLAIAFSFILISTDNWLFVCMMSFCIVSAYSLCHL